MKIQSLIFVLILLMASSAFAAGIAHEPVICDRVCWVARDPSCSISQMSTLNRGTIHHTAGAADYEVNNIEESKSRVRAIQNYHMDGNGWCDIGYNMLSDKLGNNFEGREGSLTSYPRGAHDAVNDSSFGFNIMGYYHTPYNNIPTPAGRHSLYDVIAWRIPDPFTGFGSGRYGSDSDIGFVCSHRDVGSTACPGDLMYAYIGADVYGGEARTEVNNRIVNGEGGPEVGPTPTPTPTPEPGTDVIMDNDDGPGVYLETGAWTTSTFPGYNGGTYRYATAGGANTATWTGALSEAGTYEAFVIYVAGTNRTSSTKYIVHAADGDHVLYIDQQINNLVWVSLGVYPMNVGDNSLTIDAAGSSGGGGTVVIADAARLTKVGEPTPTPTETPPPTPTPTPTATPEPGTVYVNDIAMSLKLAGKNTSAIATVWIKNNSGGDVGGATVYGDWTGIVQDSSSGITLSNGKVALTSSKTKSSGTFNFCVTDVVASGYTYDSGSNIETCDSISN